MLLCRNWKAITFLNLWRWSVDPQQYPVILEKCSCAQTGTDLKLLVVERLKDRCSPDVTMDVYLDYLL